MPLYSKYTRALTFQNFSKVPFVVTLYSEYNRALTFQDFLPDASNPERSVTVPLDATIQARMLVKYKHPATPALAQVCGGVGLICSLISLF